MINKEMKMTNVQLLDKMINLRFPVTVIAPKEFNFSIEDLVAWRIKAANRDKEWTHGITEQKKKERVKEVYLRNLLNRLETVQEKLRQYLKEVK